MTRQVLLPTMGAIGVVLFLLGVSWTWLHPPESYWSEEQAKAFVDAFHAVHAAEDSVDHGPNDPGAAAFLAARHRYDRIKSELDEARTARGRSSRYLTATGLILMLATIGVWHFWPDSDD